MLLYLVNYWPRIRLSLLLNKCVRSTLKFAHCFLWIPVSSVECTGLLSLAEFLNLHVAPNGHLVWRPGITVSFTFSVFGNKTGFTFFLLCSYLIHTPRTTNDAWLPQYVPALLLQADRSLGNFVGLWLGCVLSVRNGCVFYYRQL